VSRQVGLLVTLIALAPLLTACAGTRGESSEVRRLHAQAAYEHGLTALGDGDLAAALTALQQAATLDPTVATYRNALGLVYLQSGRPDLALAEFQRAISVDPEYADGYLNAGIALAEMTKWDEALKAYQRALQLPRLTAPDTAHQNVGVALYNLKRYPEAETELRFAIGLNPRLAAPFYHLGLVLLAVDRTDEGKFALRRARELAPDSPFGGAALQRLRALGDGGG
jgi:tetratricopeptide (TPR) repeat protein